MNILSAPAPAQTLLCPHSPPCPPADAVDHDAAHTVFTDPLMGWSRLCNGVITYPDTGESLPDGTQVAPHRPDVPHHLCGAFLFSGKTCVKPAGHGRDFHSSERGAGWGVAS